MAAAGFKKLLSTLGLESDDEEEEESKAEPKRTTPVVERPVRASSDSYRRKPAAKGRSARSAAEDEPDDAVRMVVVQPKAYDEAVIAVEDLQAGQSVVLNLENLSREVGIRVLDFVLGAVTALDGTARRVSSRIYLLAPNGVNITGDFANSFASDIRREAPTVTSGRRDRNA